MTPPSGSVNLRAPFPFGFEAAQRDRDEFNARFPEGDEDACPRCGEIGTCPGGDPDACVSPDCAYRRLGGGE